MTSKSSEWETPWEFFNKVDKEFHFTLDACANRKNKKCDNYFNKYQDGLKQKWTGVVWVNPPYGREVIKWVRKAYISSKQGATVVCLVKAATDTQWWFKYCSHGTVYFIIGRLRFISGREISNAPFPSALVIFGEKYNDTSIVRYIGRS